jgi:hypothetical protein
MPFSSCVYRCVAVVEIRQNSQDRDSHTQIKDKDGQQDLTFAK